MRNIGSRTLAIVIGAAACGSSNGPAAEETASSTGDPESTGASSDGTTSVDPTTTSSASTTTVADTSGDATTTGGDVELRGPCPLADRVGGFLFGMEAEYTAFSGSVADGVVPITVLELVGEDESCILLRRNNPFCDPLCMPGEACDFDGTCIPYPANHDVGVVTVTGLLQPVMVDPVPPTYSYFDTRLMHPAFDPGAPLELTAEGGDYEAFVLHGNGVALVEPTADELTLSTGTDVTVEWTSTGTGATLQLVMSVDQHGLSPVRLVCESEDTGSMVISSEIIADFLAFGVSGFPSADYYLQTVDSVDLTPGCVDFVVRSHDQTLLNVDGHTPCDAPADCPDGQTCDLMIQTCV